MRNNMIKSCFVSFQWSWLLYTIADFAVSLNYTSFMKLQFSQPNESLFNICAGMVSDCQHVEHTRNILMEKLDCRLCLDSALTYTFVYVISTESKRVFAFDPDIRFIWTTSYIGTNVIAISPTHRCTSRKLAPDYIGHAASYTPGSFYDRIISFRAPHHDVMTSLWYLIAEHYLS